MASLIAQFNTSIRSGVAPLTVNFTNTSTGPYNSVRWDFGDATQSTLINPSHQFINDGVYQVTLTIYDEFSGSSQAITTISIFADDDYSTSATTQQALFTSKRFSTGQVSVRKTLVEGSVVETEFPLSGSAAGTLTDGSNLIVPFTGRPSGAHPAYLELEDLTMYNPINEQIDAGMLGYVAYFANTGNTTSGLTCAGSPMFMYNITGRVSNNLVLDRMLPYFSGTSAIKSYRGFAIFSDTGSSTGYTFVPNSAYKSVEASSAIDGLSTLDIPDLYQQDTRATGLLKYIYDDIGDGSSGMFIQPTYSGWNTIESWKPNSIRLELPFIMWHNKIVAGVVLLDSGEIYRDSETNLEYTKLTIENDGTIVGKAFHTKKLISIEDEELQASLMFLSNRNYTLPAANISSTSTVDPIGGLVSGVTYFVTYRVRDASGEDFPTSQYFGNGDVQPLHCRYIQTLTPSISGNKLRVQAPASVWYISGRDINNTGFTATVVDVLIGSATTGELKDAVWHYSGDVGTYTELVTGIEIPYPSGAKTEPSFNDLKIGGTEDLPFGKDPFILGYFSAVSQSTIYKMSTTCVAKNNEFNTTQNESFDETLNESVYISEVALYNEQNELLMTGKLNTPIEKNDKKFITIKLELDL